MVPAIEIFGLVKNYGKFRALDGLSLDVKKGTVHGFLGRNGAGKTTTIKILMGLLRQDSGYARIFGEEVEPNNPGLRLGVGYMPELPSFPSHLTGRELLDIYGELYGLSERERKSQEEKLFDLVELQDYADEKIESYSKGMQQRIGIAQSLIGDPDLLILDEPSAGLDPEGRSRIRTIVKEIGKLGLTVFLSSHMLKEVEKICNYATIIDKGRVLESGRVSEIFEKFSEGARIVVEVVEHAKELANSIESIPQVERVDRKEGGEFVILSKPGVDVREDISRTITKNGGVIIGMREEKQTLEDVFLKATQEGDVR